MSRDVKVLLIGTGRMAGEHARRYASISGVEVVAAVDIDRARVRAFCDEHKIKHAYIDLQKALKSGQYDACSVVTPDAAHAPVSIQCLEAQLPVLCEKPLSDSLESAQAMVVAAKKSQQSTMVNFSYRSSGALAKARELVDSGKLGDVRHVEASYRQSWLVSDYWGDWREEDAWLWRLSQSHGSLGVLGDVGIHILDFLCAGTGQELAGLQCRLQTFNKAADNRIGDYQLDANDSCVMNVELANGALGVVHMSRYYTGYMNDLALSIHGTKGAVQVGTGQNGDMLVTSLGQDMHDQIWNPMSVEPQADTFDRFIDSVRSGKAASPDFAHAAQLQRYLSMGFDSHEIGRWIDCV